MTHEPECWHPDWIVNDPSDPCHICTVIQQGYQRGYREGYNAHATAALEWKATHGAYPKHGKGENP